VVLFVKGIHAGYSRNPMRTWLLCLALAAIETVPCRFAGAQVPAVPVESPLYEQTLAEAMRAYQAHQWPEACDAFERAYALYPNARAARGVGVTAFENGWYVRALRALDLALAQTEKPLPPELREPTELLARQAREHVGRFQIERTPGDAGISVDGAPATFEGDGSILLESGPHVLRVSAPGFVAEARELDVRGGDVATLIVDLPAEAPTQPVVAVPLPKVQLEPVTPALAAPRRDEVSTGPAWTRPVLWTAVGVAAAGTASAGALWGTGQARLRNVGKQCDNMKDGCAESDANQRIQDTHLSRLERGIDASIAIAATAALTAAVALTFELLAKRKDKVSRGPVQRRSARLRGLANGGLAF
jgi:hypothetical protein